MLPTRRQFVHTVWPLALALGSPRRLAAQPADYPRLRIDAVALREHLEGLSVFGRPPGCRFADGVSRTGYSQADVDGRAFVMAKMRAPGLAPRIDAAGNIFARRAGADPVTAAHPVSHDNAGVGTVCDR